MYSEVSDEDPLQDQTDETDEEVHSALGQENPKGPEKEDFPEDPWADKSTGVDPLQNKSPLKLHSEQTLDKLKKIADTVNPIHEENYWKQMREANLFLRLDIAAQILKEWQQADKEEALPEGSQEDTQAEDNDSVSSQAPICHDQMGQA